MVACHAVDKACWLFPPGFDNDHEHNIFCSIMELVFGKFPWVMRTPFPELAVDRDRVKQIVLAEFAAWHQPKGQYSFTLTSQDDFFRRLYDLFAFTCLGQFEPFTLHPTSRRSCWAYIQNNVRGTSVWHDHLLTSTINGVYYLTVPDATGQIWFRFRDKIMKTTPEEGWLYLFPRWLLHKPVPQKSPEHRICLNVEMITNECPISREGHWRW